MADRYFVQSEHVRGEPRIYWICDRANKFGRGFAQVGNHTTSERAAERRCERLNAEASSVSRPARGGAT